VEEELFAGDNKVLAAFVVVDVVAVVVLTSVVFSSSVSVDMALSLELDSAGSDLTVVVVVEGAKVVEFNGAIMPGKNENRAGLYGIVKEGIDVDNDVEGADTDADDDTEGM